MENANQNHIESEYSNKCNSELHRLQEENSRLAALLNAKLGMPENSITAHLAAETLRVQVENKNLRVDLMEHDQLIEEAIQHINKLLPHVLFMHCTEAFNAALSFVEQFESLEPDIERARSKDITKDITEEIPVIKSENV